MTPDDILRSYEVKRSVCARNSTLFTALLPVIQSLRQTVWSDVRFTNKFFWTGSFQWTRWTSSNQNSLSDAWQSLQLEMSQNTAVYLILWWMNGFSAPVPPTVTELSEQFDSDRRPMSCWYVHSRTESLNPSSKSKFLWFLMVYVKRWANED